MENKEIVNTQKAIPIVLLLCNPYLFITSQKVRDFLHPLISLSCHSKYGWLFCELNLKLPHQRQSARFFTEKILFPRRITVLLFQYNFENKLLKMFYNVISIQNCYFQSYFASNEDQLNRLLSNKGSACQCTRGGFYPWIQKITWRRKWQLTPVFWPEKSHGQRSLVGYSPGGHKDSDTT